MRLGPRLALECRHVMSQERRPLRNIDYVHSVTVAVGAMLVMATFTVLMAAALTELAHRTFNNPGDSAISLIVAHHLPLWSLFPSAIVAYFTTLGLARLIMRRRAAQRAAGR
jgi:hypothetical protein